MENSRPKTWDDAVRALYDAVPVTEPGLWKLTWKEGKITLEVNGKTVQTADMTLKNGVNHFGILFKGNGLLKIKHFDAKSYDNHWNTGIEFEN